MYLRHPDITVPYVDCDGSIESIATNTAAISRSLQNTIDNVKDISQFIECYVDNAIKEHEKQLIEKIASKTYDIISGIVECNIRKEEFLDLLLHDETSDVNG